MRQVFKEVLAHDKFIIEAVMILALVERTELVDTCAKQIKAQDRFFKQALAQHKFSRKMVIIIA